MAVTYRQFLIELYQEYLEEASFLYEQRLSLFDDPEITWLDVEDFEDRFEPHIDGLVVGEELALKVCKTQAVEGDFGELHAVVRVFCRQQGEDLVWEVIDQLDLEDEERRQAVTDALKYELPEKWLDELVEVLSEKDPRLNGMLAQMIGHRRFDKTDILLKVLSNSGSESIPSILWALGRLRDKEVVPTLRDYLQESDPAVASAAALALFRLGDRQTVNHCLPQVRNESWTRIPLGLGGNLTAVKALLDISKSSDVDGDCLVGLGLLGTVSAIEILLACLKEGKEPESAAMGLFLITGAVLDEEVFIPDEMDEDELFPEELEKFQKDGELPKNVDGEPFGETVTRLSENPDDWQAWWAENARRFDPKLRYRGGEPYSPAALLKSLESERSPYRARQYAYEELVIRYGLDIPFEADMFVADQKRALESISEWVRSSGSRFQPGAWYFAGQAMY